MSYSPGARLGPYEVVAPLGAGGMGEVFRARDTRLGREVALKLLPADFAADAERVARFEREAKVLASLNHPNIAVLYGFEHLAGQNALAMELVEGQGLDERIDRGAVPVEEAIPIARQIAEALEAAHEKGIVHRDLKPANVKLRPDGAVKVLDFGLAKAWDEQAAASDPAASPTLTSPQTRAGMILGTAAYMAPEQARGKPLDKRADIWAFGVVLFELLTGRRLFDGVTVPDVLAGVLTKEVPWHTLPSATPPAVARLLRRCLARDPRQRLRDIGDARLELAEPVDAAEAARQPAAAAAPWRRPAVLAALGATAVVAAAATTWVWTRLRPPVPPRVSRLAISLPPGQVLSGGDGPAITRDGRLIAYSARDAAGTSRLYLRALDRYEASVIPESEGAQEPFFSPDGSRVAFFARGKLRTAALAGGAPTALADASTYPYGGTWGEDGAIVYVPSLNTGLLSIPASGGTPRALTQPDDGAAGYAHVWPQFLPGGRSVLFSIWAGASVEARGPAVLSLATGTWTHVQTGLESSRYARSGHLLRSNPRGVLAGSFDPGRPREPGAQTFVVDDVFRTPSASNSWFTTSDNGTLVYVPGDPILSVPAWVDRDGRVTPLADQAAPFVDPTLSPDGTRLVLEDKDSVLWEIDLRRGARTRLTFDNEGNNAYPTWSRDGRRIVFASNRGGDWDIYQVPAGGGPAASVLARRGSQFPMAEAPDGTILFVERSRGTAADLWTLARDGAVTPFVVSPFGKVGAQFSPDGSLVAYISDETGRDEVYVRSREHPDDVVGVSSDGGREPRWSPDGRELFYRRGDAFFATPVSLAGSPAQLSVGDARKLFEIRAATGRSTMHPGYAVSPDGRRFLVMLLDQRAIPTQIDVVLNWFEELEAKVPAR